MKGHFFVPLLLVGLLQNAGPLAGQVRTATAAPPAKKAPAKRIVRRSAPPVDPTLGDNVDGEDLTIRRAAVAALGTMNGSVVVVDPSNGRILTMVNQKLGFKSGFIPCSTIKLVTSLAALSEHVVSPETVIHTTRYTSFNLTTAIAHSDNQYFTILGNRLGFERVVHYAQMLGLGEKAGLDIPDEQPGVVPDGPPKAGGMGLQTAYGEGFLVTPLELSALLSAIANGGTLYSLQYPRTQSEIDDFVPKVKRALDELAPDAISDLKVGMRGAVDYGTGKRANYDPNEPVLGKTGTCTDFRVSSHMGWFGSFNDVGYHRLVVVVMLTGTHSVNGPMAAGVAGAIYRNLSEQRYFTAEAARKGLPEIITTYPCCRQ